MRVSCINWVLTITTTSIFDKHKVKELFPRVEEQRTFGK